MLCLDRFITIDGQVLRGRQNADGSRSKTWEEFLNVNAADYVPPTLSESEGRAIERRNLARFRSVKINNSSIDFSTERDIIIARSEKPVTKDDIIKFEVELKQLGIKSVTGFEEFVENNEYLNEIIEDFKKLSYVFSDYFKDLKLSFGGTSKLGIRDYACYNPESRTIHLNPVFYNDFRKYFDCYSADVRENYHPKGTTYRATIFHEFGHHIEESKSIKPKIEAKKQFETFNGRYFTRKMSDQWVSDNLSEYAWQFDYGEFISESFAEYYNSQQPRELAKAVVNKIVNGR